MEGPAHPLAAERGPKNIDIGGDAVNSLIVSGTGHTIFVNAAQGLSRR